MKVLFIYHCGFSEESISIYREFVKQGVDLAVIAPSKIVLQLAYIPPHGYSYSSEDNKMGCQFFSVDLRKPESYGEGFKFFQLFSAIRKVKPDIIHVIDEYSSFYLAQTILCRNILYGRKVPVACSAGQNIHFKSPPFLFEFSLRFFKRIAFKILRPFLFHYYHKNNVAGATASNEGALDVIRAFNVKFPLRLIPWAVDISIFYPKNRNLCRKNLGIPENIKLIGNIGRFNREKGLQNLVKTLSKLEGYYLMLVGGGDYEKELQKLIGSLGIRNRIFHFKNIDRKDLVNYYNILDAFVLPSLTTPDWKEQYGRVLTEAMACHIPIIGSSSGEIPRVLKGYPKHLIFQEDSVEDLASKIREIEELKFPENFDINNFLDKYSTENFVREHIKFYKELLLNRK